MLYERNSKLTKQGIQSIQNFGLIGMFILEPAEPVPPMTAEDVAFERFQTMSVHAIKEEMGRILQTKKAPKIQVIASNIIKNYGRFEQKVNFIQNLRSKEDFIYKHSINVAILCAMMGRKLNVKLEEQLSVVLAALVHDIGKVTVAESIYEKEALMNQEKVMLRAAESKGHELIGTVFSANPNIKRMCVQSQSVLLDFYEEKKCCIKLIEGARILMVAEVFDTMTAMNMAGTTESEIAAIKLLRKHPDVFDQRVVDALIGAIFLLRPGLAIELNTGEKGLIIQSNDKDILHPVILGFSDNQVIDLSDRELYGDLEIKDIMKTMDNRYMMDVSILKENGFVIEKPEYVLTVKEE